MRVAALVPAKAHSRRLPGKNLMSLANQPLFMHGVTLAQSVDSIQVVYVSSDSNQILDLAAGSGAQGLRRPPHLCTDDATNFQVMRHHLTQWRSAGQEPDILVLLQPTTPFRNAKGLADLVHRLAGESDADSLITIRRASRVRGQLKEGYWEQEQRTTQPAARLQSAGEWYEATGHAILLRPRRTLDKGSLLGEEILAEKLPDDWADIDIDTPQDWDLAQAYATALGRRE